MGWIKDSISISKTNNKWIDIWHSWRSRKFDENRWEVMETNKTNAKKSKLAFKISNWFRAFAFIKLKNIKSPGWLDEEYEVVLDFEWTLKRIDAERYCCFFSSFFFSSLLFWKLTLTCLMENGEIQIISHRNNTWTYLHSIHRDN